MAGNPSIVVDFIANTAKLVAGMKDVGKAGADTGKAFDWKSAAKWAAGAAAIAGGAVFLKSASDATQQLTKDTLGLQRVTNLDTRTASEWVSMLQVRGIETGTFQTALGRLSKTMETSRTKSADYAQKIRDLGVEYQAVRDKGGKDMDKDLAKISGQLDRARDAATKVRQPWHDLGVNFQTLKAGNVQQVILQAADAISKMESPTKRAAAAQLLFGKQGLKLLPILMQGRKGIEDNLKTAEKYGAVIGDKQVAQTKKVIDAQRQLALAHKGVQVAIGSALLPAQAELYGQLLNLVQVVLPFVDNVNVMKGALIAFGVALGAVKTAQFIGSISDALPMIKKLSVALYEQAAAAWAAIGPWGLLAIAIAAAVAIIVILVVRNWDTVKRVTLQVWGAVRDFVVGVWHTITSAVTTAVNAVRSVVTAGFNAVKSVVMSVFNWIKSNWPLLLGIMTGPIGLAVVLILRYWTQIRSGVSAAVNAIKSIVSAGFNAVLAIVRTVFGAIVSAIRATAGRAGAAARAVVAAVKGAFSGAASWLYQAGVDAVMGLVHGIESVASLPGKALSAITSKLPHVPWGSTAHEAMSAVGQSASKGLADGITKGATEAEKAARALAQRVVNAAKTTLQTQATGLGDYLSKAFAARQQARKTPAEQALAAMQAAHEEAARQQALTDAQAQMAAATTDEERLSAQKAYNEAQYAITVAGLEKTAAAERLQLDSQQGERQKAFDTSLKTLQTHLANTHATVRQKRAEINAFMRKWGLDFTQIGELLGTSFATGLENQIGKVSTAAGKLAAAVKKAIREGLKLGSPSRVMQDAGADVARGLALGITRNTSLVDAALKGLMPGASGLTTPTPLVQTGPTEVRVFIGDQELRGLVRAEIVSSDSGLARTLLAGSR